MAEFNPGGAGSLNEAVKLRYEANDDTNAFTDAEKTKVAGIETGATADQSDAEIETAYNNQVPAASQGEAEGGTETAVRRFSPLRLAQAILALAGAPVQNNYVATTDPDQDNDTGEGYSVGSVWINTSSDESFRCTDPSSGAAVWIKTSLTADELATVALTGAYDDLSGKPTLGALAALSAVGTSQITDAAVTLAKMANLAEARIVGRAAGAGAGVPTALTAAQMLAILGIFSAGSGAPGSTPGYVPSFYMDTDTGDLYVAQGTSSSADWVLQFGAGSGDTLEAINHAAHQGDTLVGFDSENSDAAGLFNPAIVAENAQTGTSYTLVLADGGKCVSMSNSSANELTIPPNSSVAFPVGTVILVEMLNTGTTTITGGTGVTLNGVSTGSGDIAAQYGRVGLRKSATDTWIASGDIGTVA